MDKQAAEIESGLIDLSEVPLETLLTYDDPAMAHSLTRLMAEVDNPAASVGGDQS